MRVPHFLRPITDWLHIHVFGSEVILTDKQRESVAILQSCIDDAQKAAAPEIRRLTDQNLRMLKRIHTHIEKGERREARDLRIVVGSNASILRTVLKDLRIKTDRYAKKIELIKFGLA